MCFEKFSKSKALKYFLKTFFIINKPLKIQVFMNLEKIYITICFWHGICLINKCKLKIKIEGDAMDTIVIEEIIMELVVNGGDARSKAMQAIKLAKKGDLEAAKVKIKQANESLGKAHESQTKLIQSESAGKKIEVSLLMIHAQDHLMNAMTVRDLAKEMIDMYEEFRKK